MPRFWLWMKPRRESGTETSHGSPERLRRRASKFSFAHLNFIKKSCRTFPGVLFRRALHGEIGPSPKAGRRRSPFQYAVRDSLKYKISWKERKKRHSNGWFFKKIPLPFWVGGTKTGNFRTKAALALSFRESGRSAPSGFGYGIWNRCFLCNISRYFR